MVENRKSSRQPSSRSRRASPVTTRSMSSPKEGWSLEDAVRLAEQGYTLDQIERITGWAAAHIGAQLRNR